eukprot:1472059-Alexandrium_andersonii.AAC.1
MPELELRHSCTVKGAGNSTIEVQLGRKYFRIKKGKIEGASRARSLGTLLRIVFRRGLLPKQLVLGVRRALTCTAPRCVFHRWCKKLRLRAHVRACVRSCVCSLRRRLVAQPSICIVLLCLQ